MPEGYVDGDGLAFPHQRQEDQLRSQPDAHGPRRVHHQLGQPGGPGRVGNQRRLIQPLENRLNRRRPGQFGQRHRARPRPGHADHLPSEIRHRHPGQRVQPARVRQQMRAVQPAKQGPDRRAIQMMRQHDRNRPGTRRRGCQHPDVEISGLADHDVLSWPDPSRPQPAGQIIHVAGQLSHRQLPPHLGEDIQIMIKSEQRRTVPGRGHLRHHAEIKTTLPYPLADHRAVHRDCLLYGVQRTFRRPARRLLSGGARR